MALLKPSSGKGLLRVARLKNKVRRARKKRNERIMNPVCFNGKRPYRGDGASSAPGGYGPEIETISFLPLDK